MCKLYIKSNGHGGAIVELNDREIMVRDLTLKCGIDELSTINLTVFVTELEVDMDDVEVEGN